MQAIVIGLGSMGKRRIRLLQQNFPDISITGVDTNQERILFCEKEYHIESFYSLTSALEMHCYDYAFVCTSPLSHAVIIKVCLENSINVFTEINLVTDGYQENMELARLKKVKLFLSSTMIYREEMKYIKEAVKQYNGLLCYNYHVGQYLPDWHPWENYTDFFIGQKRSNGCRELLAIELPWIMKTFGPIDKVQVQKTKVTKLNIDYEDCYMILIHHINGAIGTLVVDVVSREAIRTLRIFGENLFMQWNGTPDSFAVKNIETGNLETVNLYEKTNQLSMYNKTIIENQYVSEMQQFFDEVNHMKETIYGFEDDLETLECIDKIEGKK